MTNVKLQISTKSKGYTLIEILVGLTIVALLFTIGYVNFRDFARRQAIAGAGKLLEGDIRNAQQQALSGQKPDVLACNNPNTLNGIQFAVDSATKYLINADCTGGVVTIKSVNLAAGVSVNTPDPNPIEFKVLGQGTNIPSGASAIVTLSQAATNNTFSLTIGSGGEIQ